MSLHDRESVRHKLNDDVYASLDFSVSMPKYKFPRSEQDPRHAYTVVHDELMLDGNAVGCSTTGSSEAAMLGGMAMKRRWEARRKAEGKPIDKPNLITGPVQVCWQKFTRYWDIEHREIPMDRGRLIMTPEEVIKRCDENTIGVVPTLGVTFTGDFEAVSHALDAYQKETGLDIPIHVDGASGGFLAPFCAPEVVWDFRLPRVKSINASGHKFGLAPLGVGWVIWREAKDLPEELVYAPRAPLDDADQVSGFHH